MIRYGNAFEEASIPIIGIFIISRVIDPIEVLSGPGCIFPFLIMREAFRKISKAGYLTLILRLKVNRMAPAWDYTCQKPSLKNTATENCPL